MQVVDFTNLPRRNKLYAGANGSKISVIYEGQQYLLKFPPFDRIARPIATEQEEKTEIIVSVDTVLLLPILFNSSANTTAKITMEIFVSGIPHTTPTAIPVSAECPRASEKYAIFLLTIMVPISPNSGVMISIAANAIFIKP